MDDLTKQFREMMGYSNSFDDEEEKIELEYQEKQERIEFESQLYRMVKRRKKNQRNIWFLYVLKLEHEKIYIGITNNPRKRIMQHYDGVGAKVTKAFRPIKILDVIKSTSSREYVEQIENDVTENMRAQYGERNVYGGYHVKL
ncbi:GIY-YIG nuclease family protein [Oceanobacillus sp. FSL W8-0428]|uniref:GIY-YIG nuclease family protein n=1 Tax=Bacillales TaxID=1385 RepID=UPI0030FA5CCA